MKVNDLFSATAFDSPKLQKIMSNPDRLLVPPHKFQKQNSCPQLLVSEHPSIQHLLEAGILDKDQFLIDTDESKWRMTGIEAKRERKSSWK